MAVGIENLNAIIGTPADMSVNIFDLIVPPYEWTQIFKSPSKKDIRKMALSIETYGLLHRVTLWDNGHNKFIILGGLTRIAAFHYLYDSTNNDKWQFIPAAVYAHDQIDMLDAKRIFIISNTDQRRTSTRDTINAYYHLIKLEKQKAFYGSGIFARDAAAKLANVPSATFSMYLKLMNLIPQLVDEIDNKNIALSSAFHLAFLPKDLQYYIFQKKYHVHLIRRISQKIRHSAKSYSDIDNIIAHKDDEEENISKLSFYVDNKNKLKILNILRNALSLSDLPDNIKSDLLSSFDKC